MAVSTTNAFDGPFIANGVATTFPFTFTALVTDDVQVEIDGASVSGFSVSLASGGGGSVVFDTPPTSGEIYILLDPSFQQLTQFEDGSAWLASAVNRTNDRSALRDQANKREVDRALRVPLGEAPLPMASLADSEGKVLGIVGGMVKPVPFGGADIALSVEEADAAKLAAQTAQGLAETARDASITAKGQSEAARDQSAAQVSLAGDQVVLATNKANDSATYAAASASSAASFGVLPTTVSSGGTPPNTVTAVSGGVGTGVGGTPGEYELVPTNGFWGMRIFGTIGSDGKVASYRRDKGGLSTSGTAPSFAWPSAAGFTTAPTAPTATVGLIPANVPFEAPSSDGTALLSWYNNGGTLASWPAGGTQKSLALSSMVQALIATINGSAGTRQVLGRPTGSTLVTGTAVGAATYVHSDAITSNGYLEYFDIYNPAASAGAVRIRRENKSGNNFTQVGSDLVLTVQPGLNHITYATFGSWPVNAGERLGINAYTSGAGRLAYVSATGDSSGYYDSAGAGDTGTFTDAATTTNVQLQMRFGVITALPTVGLVDQFATLSTTVSANALAIGTLQGSVNGQSGGIQTLLGRPSGATLVTGTALGGATYVYANAVTADGFLQQIELFNPTGTGTVLLRRFSKSGSTFTQVGTDLVVPVVAGLNTITYATFGSWPVANGDYIGIWPRATTTGNGLVSYLTATGDSGGYYSSGGAGNATSFTATGPITTAQFQLRLTFNTILPTAGNTADVASLKTRVTALEAGGGTDFSGVAPTGFILVWMIGQSNVSGRATTLSSKTFQTGQAYKYVRASNTLATLADPTGNDATAAAGRGSMGPALAKRVQQLSNGKIGCILINSAEGGTSIVGTGAWSATGGSWSQAVTDLSNALTLAAAAQLPIIGCEVYIQQGETDADNGVAGATYKTAFLDLQSRVQGVIGARVPMLITRIGTKNSGDTTGDATIRQAQDELVESNAGLFMVHTGTRYFYSRGLMMDSDHYVIAGYDEIGEAVGNATFSLAIGQRPKGYHG
ncbi:MULTISPECIES: sialate O-acetylesterase [unclassified Sphingomonas]|uniref:sialate O-acetylesterase n=1 Tax=Novosphingobium rhizosphaerae TaxID=1551649 RepID=UPI0015CEBAA9